MNLVAIPILVTQKQKAKLDSLRAKGFTMSGFIRALLDREFEEKHQARSNGRTTRQLSGSQS